MSEFFCGVLPYVAFTFLIVGTAIRYANGERDWSSKSSEFLAKKSLKYASPMFHLGLAMAFGGHVIGILIPKFLTDGAGIDEHIYHIIALAGSIPAGILFLTIATGCLATALNATEILGEFNYRETISPWFRSLLMFQPDIGVMENVPLIFKCHLLCAMTLITFFPFTRLVHCLSVPIEYICRSPIIYRRK